MYPIKGSDVKGSAPSSPATIVTWIVTAAFTTLVSNVPFYPAGNTACIKSYSCPCLQADRESTGTVLTSAPDGAEWSNSGPGRFSQVAYCGLTDEHCDLQRSSGKRPCFNRIRQVLRSETDGALS
jgi:hypothetical protein